MAFLAPCRCQESLAGLGDSGQVRGWSAAGRSTAQGAVLRLRGLYRGRFATPHRYPASRSAWSETGRPSRLWISGQLSPAARRRSTSAFSVSVQRCSPGLTRPAARSGAPGGLRRPRCRSATRPSPLVPRSRRGASGRGCRRVCARANGPHGSHCASPSCRSGRTPSNYKRPLHSGAPCGVPPLPRSQE